MPIGFTGHRPNRLIAGETHIVARLHDVLTALRDGARVRDQAETLIALSPLAEGADRLFASVALELGYELHAETMWIGALAPPS